MMAAGLGFTSIVGVPSLSTSDVGLSKTLTILAGGTWNNVHCADGQTPPLSSYTSASTPSGVRSYYGEDVYYSDGLPVEFSWPILPSTLDADDFKVRLNNGTSVTPQVTSIWPNFEYNERSVAVLFGHFGNRVPPGQPGAIYPTSVQVVRGSSTLELVGPGQRIVSAVGFSVKAPGSPYTDPGVPPAERGGPTLVAAKLSKMSAVGNTGPLIFRAEPAQRRDKPVRQPGKVPAPDVHVGRHDSQRRHPPAADRLRPVLPRHRGHLIGQGRSRSPGPARPTTSTASRCALSGSPTSAGSRPATTPATPRSGITTSISSWTAARPRPGGLPPSRSRRPAATSPCTTLEGPGTTRRPACATARRARRSSSMSPWPWITR